MLLEIQDAAPQPSGFPPSLPLRLLQACPGHLRTCGHGSSMEPPGGLRSSCGRRKDRLHLLPDSH